MGPFQALLTPSFSGLQRRGPMIHLKRGRILLQSLPELLAIPETIKDVGFHKSRQGVDHPLHVPTRENLKQQLRSEGQANDGCTSDQHLVGEAHAIQLDQRDFCKCKSHTVGNCSSVCIRYFLETDHCPALQLLFTETPPGEAKRSVCLVPTSLSACAESTNNAYARV